MSIWVVNATWKEDEVDVSERWAVQASSAAEAVQTVSTHLRFQPHHVEARQSDAVIEGEGQLSSLQPGEIRRLPAR
jgi:hypothetical protein